MDSRAIQRLIESEVKEHIKKGYYRSIEMDPGGAIVIARLYPEAVLWQHISLFYYNYSDRASLGWEPLVSKIEREVKKYEDALATSRRRGIASDAS